MCIRILFFIQEASVDIANRNGGTRNPIYIKILFPIPCNAAQSIGIEGFYALLLANCGNDQQGKGYNGRQNSGDVKPVPGHFKPFP